MKKIVFTIKEGVKDNAASLLILVAVIIGFAVLSLLVIYPAYKSKGNGMASSKLSYTEMLRKSGKSIPVTSVAVTRQIIDYHIMGEGVCTSKPILVPIIPMSVVENVYVREGERVKAGQLLATLDSQKAKIKHESAKLAVSTVAAELERVRLGSAYVLAQERPEVEKISLSALENQLEFSTEKLERYESAFEKGVISRISLLESLKEHSDASESFSQAQLSMRMAEQGVEQSLKIAANALGDAQQALAHRVEELKSYKVYASTAGIVDRVLIHSGEYNQDSGKPGFLISSGLWFDAYFDQSDYGFIQKGLKSSITLESYPGRKWDSHIEMVKPIVSFNSGGPEISRPLRPRGSGSPEWAATFKVSIVFDEENTQDQVITGMTGFTRLKLQREALVVPKSAVLSLSAGSAVVYVVNGDDWSIREVSIGYAGGEQVEILDGLIQNEKVLMDGHINLKVNDKIAVDQE